MKHVIIGSGAAGVKAAEVIRRRCPNAEITMISMDDAVHSRCMLHLYLSHERNEHGLNFVDDDFFYKNQIELLHGMVTTIDTKSKTVALKDRRGIKYDKLLIATGANSVIPPIGALKTAGNVFGLRHLTDARNIAAHAAPAKKIVIIGSGLIGMDAAYALLHNGKAVTVVEMLDRILPLNLDAHAAAAYQTKFAEAGCAFRLASKVCDTVCNTNGYITGIILENGEQLACDMVIIAAGVKPAIEFLANSDIVYDRAVAVNSCLQTSNPDVYAAGDVTGLSGIWPNAAKQGETAARNMCGDTIEYLDSFAAKNTINFFGIPSLSLGVLDARDQNDRELVKECRRCYKKIILRDNVVAGVIFQGGIDNSGIWQYLIKNQIDVSGLGDALWTASFADFYQTDAKAQFKWF